MRKDKEWLKNEIEIMGSEISENYPREQTVNREEVLSLIDQLDEPEQLVVPKFAADWYEENEDDLEFEIFNLVTTLSEKGYDELTDLEAWFNNFENGPIETFMRMKLFGYKVEKERLYYVLDKNNHTMLYRSFDYSIAQVRSKHAVDPTRKNFNLNEYQLTEQEIRNYDARFMAFAVEVAE